MKVFLTLFSLLLPAIGFSAANAGGVGNAHKLSNISLKKEADTVIINRLNKLAANYFNTNPDSTVYYAKMSVALARKTNYRAGLANGLMQTAHADFAKGNFNAATKSFDEAILLFKQLNNKNGLAECYALYAKMYKLLADYTKALNYLNQAVVINQQINNEPNVADCYKNIGIVYYSKGELSAALDYYFKSLFINIKLNDKGASAANYNNIGVTLQSMEAPPQALKFYKKALLLCQETNNLHGIGIIDENIAEVLLSQNKNDQALNYLSNSLKILKKQDDKEAISAVYTDMGLCYANKNELKQAVYYLNAALNIAQKYNIVFNEATALIGFAKVYNQQKDYKTAYIYAVKGQKLALKLGNISVRANAARRLNETLAGLGAYGSAYKMLRQYNELKDSLHNDESLQKLTSYNMKLDFEERKRLAEFEQHKKDSRYKQRIAQQRSVIILFLIVILAMLGVSWVYYLQKRKQQKINSKLEEKNREVLEQKVGMDAQAKNLNELNSLKDRLISILAHDLRAPLSTLRGLFSLLQDDTISHAEMIQMMPEALKKLEYTSDFLDTLLFWINSQMENFENAVKDFKIKGLIALETGAYQEQAALKGISLIDSVPDGLIAYADPNSIRIVIRNLITNAIKFSDENDKIEITASAYDEKNQLISVSDTGTGISDGQLNKLFKTKVDSKTGTSNETGTGMGMLFCKDLVEKCNGKIWVSSKQGEGTTFYFTVPAGVLNKTPVDLISQ